MMCNVLILPEGSMQAVFLVVASAVAFILSCDRALADNPIPVSTGFFGLPRIDMVDRAPNLEIVVDNKPLPKFVHNGQIYVIAPKNKDYQLFLRCNTPEKVMAFATVDGLSIMTGKKPEASDWGYVIKQPGSFIPGYRLNGKSVARFHFADKHVSCAAKMKSNTSQIGEISVRFMAESVEWGSGSRMYAPSYSCSRGARFDFAPNVWKVEPSRTPGGDLGTAFGDRLLFQPGTTRFQATREVRSITVPRQALIRSIG